MKHIEKRAGCMFVSLLALLTFGISGCSFAPSFVRPDVPLEDRWVGTALSEQTQDQSKKQPEEGSVRDSDGLYISSSLPDWQEYFRDPQLQQLISLAIENNHDLKKAALMAEQVRAAYRITRSTRLPEVTGRSSVTRTRTAKDMSFTGAASTGNVWSVGLGVTAFELDLFGRVKNQSEAKLNDYLSTLEARDSVHLSVISAVAKTWYAMRINNDFMTLANDVRKSREETLALTRLQIEAGTASETTLQGMISAIELAKADYQAKKRAWMQARNALSNLIGLPLSKIESEPARPFTEQFPEKAIFVGIPSKILLNRPDIRAAEYTLKSANANIGAARAACFPAISLTGSLGFASTDLSRLFNGDNLTWSLGPGVMLPIFDYGKRHANVERMEILQKMAVESYVKTLQNAFADVDNALVARETLNIQFAAIKKSDAAVADRLHLTNMQLREGVVDGLTLLDAERESFHSRQGVLAIEQLILNNQVDLYIALGGGL